MNRYSYALNNPLRYVDPTGRAAADLQWLDESGFSGFQTQGPYAEAQYVKHYAEMAKIRGVPIMEVMRNVTIAISNPSAVGKGLWEQPVDQTGLAFGPQRNDVQDFGENMMGELRWGKVRIVFSAGGDKGGRAQSYAPPGGYNALTFAADLIVFTRELNFDNANDQRWLMHELAHVMQAQVVGDALWWAWWVVGLGVAFGDYYRNRWESDANAFASLIIPPILPAAPAAPSAQDPSYPLWGYWGNNGEWIS